MSCDVQTMPSIDIDIDLEEVINSSMYEKSKGDIRDYSHFHPSEFSQCSRKQVYRYYEYEGFIKISKPDIVDSRLQRIFNNGHHVHYRLGGDLQRTTMLKGVWRCSYDSPDHPLPATYGADEKLGIKKPDACSCGFNKFNYEEVGFLDDDTMIGGHVDAVLDLRGFDINGKHVPDDAPIEDSHMIVDFKSIRWEGFKNLTEPKSGHIIQMQIYLYLSGLKFGKFLYENKNDQNFKQFLVVRDDEIIAREVEKAKTLKHIVKHTNSDGVKTLPPRDSSYKKNTKECVECRYRSHCWGLK